MAIVVRAELVVQCYMTLLSVSYSDAGAAPPGMTLTLFQSGVCFRYQPQPYPECVRIRSISKSI
jgi:hypothetical protein